MKFFIKEALPTLYPRLRYSKRMVKRFKDKILNKSIRKKNIDDAFEKMKSTMDEIPLPYKRNVPVHALVELTNVCNLNCTMCNIHDSKRATDFMKPSTFERVLDQLDTIGKKDIGLYYLGETFVFPHLDRILKIAEKRKFKVHIRSNAHYAKRIDKLHEQFPNLMNSLSFSIDGATKETFEKVRLGGKMEKVYESLETVHNINKEKIDSRIDMAIYSVLSKDNIYEIPDYFNNFSKYCYPNNIKFFLLESVSTAVATATACSF